MRDKSKFIAFMLSAIPGLAHFYINLKERALIFFMITFSAFMGSIGLYALTGRDSFILIFIFAYPIIWLVSTIDMFSVWKRIELSQLYNNENTVHAVPIDDKSNKKTITLALSIMPGAGHMYLGYQTKGLLIMGIFLFSIFFMGWLGISLPLFLLPLIWFYGLFDAMHIVDGSEEVIKKQDLKLSKIKPEWIGFGLIGIGIIAIVERILYPLIHPSIRSYIQTSIVSLLFIIAGIAILIKNKKGHNSIDKIEVKDNESK